MKSLQSPHFHLKSRCLYLDFCWLAGLSFGCLLGCFCRAVPSPTVLVTEQRGIACVILPMAFWPIVSYLLVLFFPWQVLLPVAFLRGAALTFVWCVLWEVFQPVGYIFSPILLLADLLMTPILFFLWLRLLPGSPGKAFHFVLLCLSFSVMAGFASYRLVMPASVFLIERVFRGIS